MAIGPYKRCAALVAQHHQPAAGHGFHAGPTADCIATSPRVEPSPAGLQPSLHSHRTGPWQALSGVRYYSIKPQVIGRKRICARQWSDITLATTIDCVLGRNAFSPLTKELFAAPLFAWHACDELAPRLWSVPSRSTHGSFLCFFTPKKNPKNWGGLFFARPPPESVAVYLSNPRRIFIPQECRCSPLGRCSRWHALITTLLYLHLAAASPRGLLQLCWGT